MLFIKKIVLLLLYISVKLTGVILYLDAWHIQAFQKSVLSRQTQSLKIVTSNNVTIVKKDKTSVTIL